MCGRYVLKSPSHELARRFCVDEGDARVALPTPRYNAAPTQLLPVIVELPNGKREVREGRWGWNPKWAKGPITLLINARSETVAEKPTFKKAFLERRCLVPGNLFYEWNAQKIPHVIEPVGPQAASADALFAFAGLWEEEADPKTGEIRTHFTLLTAESDGELHSLHDRRPLILFPEAEQEWLDGRGFISSKSVQLEGWSTFVRDRTFKRFSFHAVSKAVGRVQNDDPSLIDPAELF